MTLIKNEIPILEYDDTQRAVMMPDRDGLFSFPRHAVYPFIADELEEFAWHNSLPKIGEFVSATKTYSIYEYRYAGLEICLCQAPVGAAPAAQILDFLISYGVRNVISAGSCGALLAFEENEFLIPTEALRAEGTSYHYLPPARTVKLNSRAVHAIESAFKRREIPYHKCKTWTTDGIYRETEELVRYRIEEGCSVVEMECAALAACAQFRGATFGQILYTADTLAEIKFHDNRNWGEESIPHALELALDAVVLL